MSYARGPWWKSQPGRVTNESVGDAQRASEELARMSSELQTLVGTFHV